MESFFSPTVEQIHSGPAKTRCAVRLSLADGRVLDADIYLLSDSVRPGGVMSVEATLDGHREFIPIIIDGANSLLSRSSIRVVDMSADGAGAGDLQEAGGTLDVVKLRIDSGEILSGVLRFPAPVESMRMSDVFNRPGRFLALSVGDRLILVSKAHVVEASF